METIKDLAAEFKKKLDREGKEISTEEAYIEGALEVMKRVQECWHYNHYCDARRYGRTILFNNEHAFYVHEISELIKQLKGENT